MRQGRRQRSHGGQVLAGQLDGKATWFAVLKINGEPAFVVLLISCRADEELSGEQTKYGRSGGDEQRRHINCVLGLVSADPTVAMFQQIPRSIQLAKNSWSRDAHRSHGANLSAVVPAEGVVTEVEENLVDLARYCRNHADIGVHRR